MRYLISVVHDGPEPKGDASDLHEAMGAFVTKLTEDGTLVDAAGLAPIEKAKRVDLRSGKIRVLDGPFTEAKEWIGGFFMVQVASESEAVEIARQSAELHRKHFPGFDITHEVRQVMEG